VFVALGHLRGIRGHEAPHLLFPLRLYLVRDGYNVGKQYSELQILHVLVQRGKKCGPAADRIPLLRSLPGSLVYAANPRRAFLHRCAIVSGLRSNHSCSAGTPRNVFEFTPPGMVIQ
jgi:hypothetical protein